jgi:hypothetical protein
MIEVQATQHNKNQYHRGRRIIVFRTKILQVLLLKRQVVYLYIVLMSDIEFHKQHLNKTVRSIATLEHKYIN